MMNPTTQLFERGEPPTMQEGDVLLTPIPQADGQVKTVPPFFSERSLRRFDLLSFCSGVICALRF